MTQNYKLTIQYDGSRYYGWEHQKSTDLTIQGKIETVLARMLAEDRGPEGSKTTGAPAAKAAAGPATGTPAAKAPAGPGAGADPAAAGALPVPEVLGAGRTDAGVHARAMTASVRLDTERSADSIQEYLNAYLPEDICVTELKEASPRFHARYSAVGKTYCYSCWTGKLKPVFERKYLTVLPERPDVEKMRQAAAYLTGTHDFKSFCGNPKMKKSTVRTVDSIEIKEKGPVLRFWFHGDGFLQHMVRILTGTLLEVGFGKRQPEDMVGILEALDRTAAGYTAPAKGLCLMQVDY